MTISTTSNKTGLFAGTGSNGPFAFTFKTFASGDLEVIRVSALGVESVLTETSQYSVSLNADQNNNPGGSVTTTTPVASGEGLMVRRLVDATQLTDIQNAGGFYPEVLENAFDKVTMGLQQHDEMLSRALLMDITDTSPVASASEILAAGVSAAASAVSAAASAAASAASAALSADKVPLAGGTMTGALNMGAGARMNHARGTVASAAQVDVWSAGDTVEVTGVASISRFSLAPQAGARRTLICSDACTFLDAAGVETWSLASPAPYAGSEIEPKILALADGRLLTLYKGASATETYIGTVNPGLTDISWVASTPLPTPVPVRQICACVLADGRILYLAGYTGTPSVRDKTVLLGTISGDTIAWAAGSALPSSYTDAVSSFPASHSACTLLDGRIFIMGGFSGGSPTDVAYFGTVSGNAITWAAATAFPSAVAWSCSTVLPDGRLYVKLSYPAAGYFGTVSGDTITWTAAGGGEPQYTGDDIDHAGICILPDGRLMSIGGTVDSPSSANLDEVFFGAISGTTVTWTPGGTAETGNTVGSQSTVAVIEDTVFVLPSNPPSDTLRVQIGLPAPLELALEGGDHTASAGEVVEVVADTTKRTLVRPLKVGGVGGGTNLGAGAEVFETLSGNALRFRTLTAGTNITITENANDISIASAASAGEANTASNLGAGNGVFASKSGVDLRFKSLIAGTNVTLSNTANDITINATSTSGGTVTHSAGALTASAVMVGNGTDDSKVLASLGTTTTLLHGNAAGLPTWGAVALASDVSGILPVANGGTGRTTLVWDTAAGVGAMSAMTRIRPSQSNLRSVQIGTGGEIGEWVEAAVPYLAGYARAAVIANGNEGAPMGLVAAVRNSDTNYGIAISAVAHTTSSANAAGFPYYGEFHIDAGAAASQYGICMELDFIDNRNLTILADPYSWPSGSTVGISLLAGKPGGTGGAAGPGYKCSSAMRIGNHGPSYSAAKWLSGIVFMEGSIAANGGPVGAEAIGMAQSQGLQWYVGSNTFGPWIRSDVSSAATGMGIIFHNGGIAFQNASAVNKFNVDAAGTIVTAAGTVSYGAADSGGAGYRLMRVPN